tara:strand:+ start:669 stop:1160 length:492 start_codon:yes stop_codon:yes gene_type:complete
MAVFLFVTPATIAKTTGVGGNVDLDTYTFWIEYAQKNVIEPMLGTELYDLIVAGATASSLTGLYLTLYNEYVQPITKFQATAEFISVASYTIANGGIFKHAPDGAEVVDKEESQYLAGKYSAMAQMYVLQFEKWITKNPLTEYKVSQDEVDAQSIKLTGGWYL